MTSVLYNNYKKLEFSGQVDLMNSGIYIMLVSGSYDGSNTSNYRAANANTGQIGLNEAVGPGYVMGGQKLVGRLVGFGSPAGTDEAYFDADDVTWGSSTITASGAVIYQSGYNRNIESSHLIAYLDFGQNQTSTNGTFQIQWNSQGIINWG